MERIEKLFLEGKSFREIERLTGVNRKTASKYIQSKGYHVTKRGTTGSKRQVQLTEDVFNKIDNAEKAYWLGFLYADGAVSDKAWVVELSQKEEEHLVRFKDFLRSNAKIYSRYVTLNGIKYKSFRINVCSKILVTDLKAIGCTPNKSKTKKFPRVEQRFYVPFIAGYFDGNGTVMKRKETGKHYGLITTGSKEFAEALKEFFSSNMQKKKGFEAYTVYVKVKDLPKLREWSIKVQRALPPS